MYRNQLLVFRAAFSAFLLGLVSSAVALAQAPDPPRVLWIEPVGADLEVTFFRGSPAPAVGLDVVVTGGACGETARVFAPTPTDSTVAVVPNALDDVASCGTSFRASLEDAAGPVGTDLPFLIGLDCNNTLQCDLTVDPWVDAQGALVLSPQLDQALSADQGSGDLVAAVSSRQPQLKDALLGHALRLDRLVAQSGSWTSGCSCRWTGLVERSGTPRGGWLSARACPDRPSQQSDGSTSLKTVTRCYTLGQGPGVTLSLPASQTLTIPAFDRCSGSSGPVVSTFRATFDGFAEAGGDLGHGASASTAVDLAFDGQTQLTGTAVAQRGAASPQALVTDTLSLDSGPVAAHRGSISAAAQASVQPVGSPTLLQADTRGSGILKALYGPWHIELGGPGPVNDTVVGGGDPEPCDGVLTP